MKKTYRFFTLLAHKTWNRIIGRIIDIDKWAILFHFVLYNAVYVSIMAGLLYLTFVRHSEELSAANPFPIILLSVQCLFVLSFISLVVIGCEEALIRSVFSKKNPRLFDDLFDMQNILMGLLSIMAIIAAVTPSIADNLNRILLFCGIILFACILVTTLYDGLFLRVHAIEEILHEIE